MNRFLLSSLVLALAVVSTACDKGGLYPYGRLTDVIVPCGDDATVYVRSLEDATEVLILGRKNPLQATTYLDSRCFVSATIEHNTTTLMDYGIYRMNAQGVGEVELRAEFRFTYQPNLTVSGRRGSARNDFPPGEFFEPVGFEVTGDRLDLDFYDRAGVYTQLDTVLDRIDLSTQAGREDLYQLFTLSLYVGQVRVPAFGGLGMTRYITSPSDFAGITSGEFNVSVKSLTDPTASIDYRQLYEFPNISIEGLQVTGVNISGDGPMTGILDFEIHDPTTPTTILWAGSIDYENIEVRNGIASEGTYGFATTIPSASTTNIPYSFAENVDLRRVLPVEP